MALVQVALTAIFMLAFGFPKIMILIFGGLILIANVFSAWLKLRTAASRRVPQKPVVHPVLFRILSIGIALCSLALVATLLFGFVIFINSWTSWHNYEGQHYRTTDFRVTRAYYQKHNRGADDVFASGMVDGQREWMGLLPYLHSMPHSQGELDARVPAGTSIPIYLFPDLKGRARVRVHSDTPPAEAYHRSAITALNYGLFGLAMEAGAIFLLIRIRRFCFAVNDAPIATAGPELETGAISQ